MKNSMQYDMCLSFAGADARSHTNQLMRSGIHTSQELYQFIKEQEEVCDMPQKGTSLVAVDTRGRYYTSSGAMGLTENINYFFDEPGTCELRFKLPQRRNHQHSFYVPAQLPNGDL